MTRYNCVQAHLLWCCHGISIQAATIALEARFVATTNNIITRHRRRRVTQTSDRFAFRKFAGLRRAKMKFPLAGDRELPVDVNSTLKFIVSFVT
jgi:hypothetical protein